MNTRILILLTAFFICLLQVSSVIAANNDDPVLQPILNNGQKWRIGYIESGPYSSFPIELQAIVEALMQIGWIKPTDIPPIKKRGDAAQVWNWLARELQSDTIEFVDDAFYSANWNKTDYEEQQEQLLPRLHDKQDLDLLLVFGTPLSRGLLTDRNNVNTLIIETTDAISAGLIKSPTDSGRANIYANIDPERYMRQLFLFHSIFDFKSLGVVYEDSPRGRNICSLKKIQEVARERKFTIIPCYAPFNDKTQEQAEQETARCYEQLASKVDAVYITYHPGVTLRNLPNIARPLLRHKIPSFTQGTDEEVKRGVLFSISMDDYNLVARNLARIIAKVFHGTNPGSLQQPFTTPLKLTINLKTAQEIDYDPSINILSAADYIYQNIRQN
ncbi:ABC transporter substrate binding protein [Desulfopila sp. IMCC35008]|uniref:ABC transporter substrate binding protein n=1 Tax=Desulfopila sp. IMCC35008 TaxID=2653858 RepID=UPI0013D28E8B|nr:ABC transporter substrate binding protein [Desulfopila sp. IMCC35008]